ncbi:MAG: dienelactone hydrolase [Planctomycetota bacterium]
MQNIWRIGALIWVGLVYCGLAVSAQPSEYDPLAVADIEIEWVDVVVVDESRGREIPLRVYLPGGAVPEDDDSDTQAFPVVMFSHGLGGSRENNPYLGEHWAKRGYIAVFMQHLGSDESVWKDLPRAEIMPAMQRAASGKNKRLRTQDVSAVLDQLERWNDDPDSPLAGRLDLDRLGMSGHSFGAVTTQAVSGQRSGWPSRDEQAPAEPRIKAAVIMSPSVPQLGNPDRAFGGVTLPWLLMTGTQDIAPIGAADMASRLGVYPALPDGDKYELVLHDAQHHAFSDHRRPPRTNPRNPNHHRVILALSTAFWDAYLLKDPEAKRWLQGAGPPTVLEPDDSWQHK